MTVNQNVQIRSASSGMSNALSVHPNASTASMNPIVVPSAKPTCASMKRTTTAWQYARRRYRSSIQILKVVSAMEEKKL